MSGVVCGACGGSALYAKGVLRLCHAPIAGGQPLSAVRVRHLAEAAIGGWTRGTRRHRAGVVSGWVVQRVYPA